MTDDSEVEKRAKAAVAMIRREQGVIAMERDSKSPPKGPDCHGYLEATRDAKSFYLLMQQDSTLNYAVCPPPGFIIIDFDGDEAFAGFCRVTGADPAEMLDTFTVRTPRKDGGRHCYYVLPVRTESYGCPNGVVPGVDIRSGKGYVLGPWSRVAKGLYQPENNKPFSLLPNKARAWLFNRQREKEQRIAEHREKRRKEQEQRKVRGDSEIGPETLAHYLALLDPDCGRDEWLFILWGCNDAPMDSDIAEAMARDWSKKSPKYDDESFDKAWTSDRGGGRGFGTIPYLSRGRLMVRYLSENPAPPAIAAIAKPSPFAKHQPFNKQSKIARLQ